MKKKIISTLGILLILFLSTTSVVFGFNSYKNYYNYTYEYNIKVPTNVKDMIMEDDSSQVIVPYNEGVKLVIHVDDVDALISTADEKTYKIKNTSKINLRSSVFESTYGSFDYMEKNADAFVKKYDTSAKVTSIDKCHIDSKDGYKYLFTTSKVLNSGETKKGQGLILYTIDKGKIYTLVFSDFTMAEKDITDYPYVKKAMSSIDLYDTNYTPFILVGILCFILYVILMSLYLKVDKRRAIIKEIKRAKKEGREIPDYPENYDYYDEITFEEIDDENATGEDIFTIEQIMKMYPSLKEVPVTSKENIEATVEEEITTEDDLLTKEENHIVIESENEINSDIEEEISPEEIKSDRTYVSNGEEVEKEEKEELIENNEEVKEETEITKEGSPLVSSVKDNDNKDISDKNVYDNKEKADVDIKENNINEEFVFEDVKDEEIKSSSTPDTSFDSHSKIQKNDENHENMEYVETPYEDLAKYTREDENEEKIENLDDGVDIKDTPYEELSSYSNDKNKEISEEVKEYMGDEEKNDSLEDTKIIKNEIDSLDEQESLGDDTDSSEEENNKETDIKEDVITTNKEETSLEDDLYSDSADKNDILEDEDNVTDSENSENEILDDDSKKDDEDDKSVEAKEKNKENDYNGWDEYLKNREAEKEEANEESEEVQEEINNTDK